MSIESQIGHRIQDTLNKPEADGTQGFEGGGASLDKPGPDRFNPCLMTDGSLAGATREARREELLALLGHRPIVLVGMMGAGKTTVGRRLAARLGRHFVDSDEEVEKAAGMTIPEIFAAHGEADFRAGEARVVSRLLKEPDIVLGTFAFSADAAPDGSRVAIARANGGYEVAASQAEARASSGNVQGRNSTIAVLPPLDVPKIDGAVLTLATSFVEPAHVEPDASWCQPGGAPSSPFANAGAFGAKRHSSVAADARQLADELGEPVLVLWPREEVVRRGAKRPPVALAMRADGTGELRVAMTPGSDDLGELLAVVADLAPGLETTLVHVPGPRIGATHRGAVVAEVLAALTARDLGLGEPATVVTPNGARATVTIDPTEGAVAVQVAAGDPLCPITLRSYVNGAVHQALGMVRSEGIAVDDAGEVHDLTIRSFGILTASQTPPIVVDVIASDAPPVAAGVAVLAATMAAAWVAAGKPASWPCT